MTVLCAGWKIFHHSLQLNTTPLSIAEIFEKQIGGSARAWIFTSATLAVKKDFSLYQSEMGLLKAKTACWDSPFNYGEQALLYVPQNLPEPNTEGYTEAVVQAALPLIEASKGRAFLLFTSLRAMGRAQRNPAGGIRPARLGLSADAARGRFAQRDADALPRARKRGAAR